MPADIAEILKTQAKQAFGSKLKELRRKAGLTQQEIAAKVGVDATYLSKIENGVMPPPSRGIIILLGEVLRTNKEELIALAGKTPVNIEKMRKKLNARSERRLSMPKLTPTFAFRGALVMFLVVAFLASLWFAAPTPVKAVDITISNPTSGILGSSYAFTVRVDVQDTDLLPIQSVDLRIYKASSTGIYSVLFSGLPLPATAGATSSKSFANTGGGTATISGTTGAGWVGLTQDNRYGYGYGYQSQGWEEINFGYGYGYGYGYGGGYTGSTYIDYTVAWVPPSSWPIATYRIETIVYGTSGDESKAFTNDTVASFVLNNPASPGSGGGGTTPAESGVTDVTVGADNKFTADYTAKSDDNQVTLDIDTGDVGETADGQPLTSISIKKMASPPALPADTNKVALVYDLGPAGAQFPDGVTLTMKYDAAMVQGGILVISYWDGSAWVDLEGPFEIDEVNHTISTTIFHFTPFTVMEYVNPAAFTASNLTISPASVGIGKAAAIGVTITNDGDFSGEYDVVLKVNNLVTETKKVTVAARSSLNVSFALSESTAGTYVISVDGLTGTLTVTAPVSTPTPTPTPTPTLTPTPTPTPKPTPTPTPTPLPTLAEPEEGMAPWVIGVIIAAVVIICAAVLVILIRRRA